MSEQGPVRVGDLLGGLLEGRGLREQLERTSALERWPEVVGERIAEVTHPLRVHDTVLIVEVRTSAWLMELNFLRKDILSRLNGDRSEGRIEKLVFVQAETA